MTQTSEEFGDFNVGLWTVSISLSHTDKMGMEKVALPFVGMVMAEFAQVGLMIVGKEAMSKGMSNLVFIFYSNAFASLILLPSALLFHRFSLSLKQPLQPFLFMYVKKKPILAFVCNLSRSQSTRPQLSFCILCGLFLLGLIGWVIAYNSSFTVKITSWVCLCLIQFLLLCVF